MGFRKFSPLLALSILVLFHAGSLQAAPFRSALESSPDLSTLSEEEARLLLAALVQDYMQMKASELELEQEQEPEGSRLHGVQDPCSALAQSSWRQNMVGGPQDRADTATTGMLRRR
ncbi:calcitonin gene-related peptide 2 isoform X3 [Tupaia chinensis]|uniref:calcitonin gene-related peptide 2 isoform X3 n=1 Tax=Tupaia chinensis TaxID=246437 RepID=UPI000FFC9C58|nr:calcitonin gene-related peptide 2 isoform X3 [Tupaia chinensis]